MKEYEIYFPLFYNDGRSVAPEKLKWCKQILVNEFGGLTHFPQESEGLWKVGGRTFRDKIVILRVLAADSKRAREFFSRLRETLRTELAQAEVLIVERDVEALE